MRTMVPQRRRYRRHQTIPAGASHYQGFHAHPVQGQHPYDPGAPHPGGPQESDPAWDPYRAMPGVLQPEIAGAGALYADVPAGPFAGIGPRNYARGDRSILEEVCELLTEHGELDVHDVEVKVKNGNVTLEGTVADRWSRREIEAVADTVSGVRDVENRLEVHGPEPAPQ
jgi:BON domain